MVDEQISRDLHGKGSPHHQCVVLPLRHWHGTQPKRRGHWYTHGHEYSDCILLYILVALTSVAEFRFEL